MTDASVPGALWERGALVERLARSGVPAGRAATAAAMLGRAAETLRDGGAGAGATACAFLVPGRIEVLGKHTDYAGGRSLLAAPERGVAVVAVPRADGDVRVVDVADGQRVMFPLSPMLEPVSGWAAYPVTAARRLARNFPQARTGASVAFLSDLPMAAGMSSSSALLVAVFQALAAVNRLEETERWRSSIRSPEELAGYLAAVENGEDFGALAGDRGVGTRGGSEDHTAMLCARAGCMVQYAFAPVRFERELPLPADHCFVIAASGVRAEKTGAARERYNRAAELMRVASLLWRQATGGDEPTVGAILDTGAGAATRLREILAAARHERASGTELLRRVEQFVAEDREIIPAAGDALLDGELDRFGKLVDRSQHLAERLLGNQIAETSFLARSAREAGAVAASAFGAGFGGSVWAMVPRAIAGDFIERWRGGYVTRFPEHAGEALFFRTGAGTSMVRVG